VLRKGVFALAGLYVPEHTGLVARGSDDGALIDEAAAGQIAVVSSQLSVRSITTMCDNDEYDDDNDDGDNDG